MSLIKIWFAATAALIAGVMVWNFAPILVPLLAVTIGLGGLVAVIVWLARQYQRQREATRGE